ncbi:hypothetical protein BS639_04155 [Rouxiella silvae]|uniref:Multiple antibiotic resistance regulatory periplasmic protein MarB n=1 Tax=Rouxiella silvae TaxID=1646373 RepID=A0ABX3U5L2_9GAMM|nr:hypothetical protein [Rouxiella silvae]KQN44194.1 hypothetical protein ASE93_16295 [Serratia sp. Leaf50]ORJ22588.1 hypothetical protein BS639_04155 [Rouxiella silvae]
MISSKSILAALLLSSAALGVQAAEIPLSSVAQPCVEHASFNVHAGNHDMINIPEQPANQSSNHCLTSLQSSNSNKLFGNNELLK